MLKFLLKLDQDSGAPNGAAPNNVPAPITPPPAAEPQAPNDPGKSAGGWYDSFKKQEIKDYVIQKGFKDPEVLADSYQQLEKLKGVGPDKLIQIPDSASAKPEDWQKVYERLGKPADAEGYKIEATKENGAPKEFVDWAKSAFHKANLTTAQAEALYGEWNQMNQSAMQKTAEELKAAHDQNVNELKSTWGNAYEQNLNIAKSAYQEFGVKVEAVEAMEKAIGTKATMDFFHKIGAKLGEGSFVQGDGKSNGFGKMSPEAAKAQLNNLKQDSGFMAKAMTKSNAEYKLYSDLMRDAYPGEMSL